MNSFCLEGSKVRFAAFLLRRRAYDWWIRVVDAMRAHEVEVKAWTDFVARFSAKFPLAIKV